MDLCSWINRNNNSPCYTWPFLPFLEAEPNIAAVIWIKYWPAWKDFLVRCSQWNFTNASKGLKRLHRKKKHTRPDKVVQYSRTRFQRAFQVEFRSVHLHWGEEEQIVSVCNTAAECLQHLEQRKMVLSVPD